MRYRLSDRSLRCMGLVASVASLSGLVLGLVIAGRDGDQLHMLLFEQDNGINAVVGIAGALLAPAITWARPRHRVGWLLHLMTGTDAVVLLGQSWAGSVLVDHHALVGGQALAIALGWLSSPIWPLSFVPFFTVLLALYPEGHPASRGWRVVQRGGWLATGLFCTGLALSADAYTSVVPAREIPFHGAAIHAVGNVLAGAGGIAALTLGTAAIIGTIVRLHRAVSPVREQLAWLLVAIAPVTVSTVLAPVPVTLGLAVLMPLGLVIGIVRYQLLDITVVLRRTLVYGSLTGLVLAIYVAIVSALTAVANRDHLPEILAATAVAIGIRPAYEILQQVIDRYVYGDRRDPVRALARLGDRLSEATTESDTVQALAQSVADALRVAYVELEITGTASANIGQPTARIHETPLVVAGERVGCLRVGSRVSGERLSRADLHLVQILAGPIGAAARSTSLAAALARSREHLLAATEQERARLRQDLHDGLGPSLSGVALGLEAASTRASDPGSRELLERLRSEVADALLDIRRLVDGLRPAVLDEGGLVEALRRHGEAVTARNEAGLVVSVHAKNPLSGIPAPVEIAAYRIALEAVTNVVRHAAARRCVLRLSGTDELLVEVSDDGLGLPPQDHHGVGMESMRRRAEELSGHLEVRSEPGRGTTVTARLPLVVPAMTQ